MEVWSGLGVMAVATTGYGGDVEGLVDGSDFDGGGTAMEMGWTVVGDGGGRLGAVMVEMVRGDDGGDGFNTVAMMMDRLEGRAAVAMEVRLRLEWWVVRILAGVMGGDGGVQWATAEMGCGGDGGDWHSDGRWAVGVAGTGWVFGVAGVDGGDDDDGLQWW
ncbi:hypothetical protein F0562_025757 [Nyssa sinensis]|uniref:Uncharacterized protein n=1 Tax=Nyssa sinensis TaxID=561372 RepID=A0A5J5B765_9ASTE|nr:hypothetical protein F0562_025757 [Nyssa sinensis]